MEYGVTQSITTSRGFVLFNNLQSDGGMGLGLGTGNGYLLQAIRRAVFPTLRNPTSNRPQKHGGIAHPFFKGAKFIEFEGLVVATTAAKRQTLDDHMRGSLDPLLEENGVYAWTPPGATERTHNVRLFEPVSIVGYPGVGGQNAGPKTFAFILIVGDTLNEAG